MRQHVKWLVQFPMGQCWMHGDILRGPFWWVVMLLPYIAPVSKGVCLVHEVGRKQDNSALTLSLQHAPRGATAERVHA